MGRLSALAAVAAKPPGAPRTVLNFDRGASDRRTRERHGLLDAPMLVNNSHEWLVSRATGI